MRAPDRFLRSGLLLVVAALVPLALGAAGIGWWWRAAGRARQTHAARVLALARTEAAALLGIDRLVLDGLAAAPRSPRLPPVPERARQAGGMVALFALDAAGRGRGASATAVPALLGPLRAGAALAAGQGCPVGPNREAGGFFLAETEAGPPGVAPAALRGAVGACVRPAALRRGWRALLGPGESLRLIRLAGAPTPPPPPKEAAVPTARIPVTAVALAAPAARPVRPALDLRHTTPLLEAGRAAPGAAPQVRLAPLGASGLAVVLSQPRGARFAAWWPGALAIGIAAMLTAALAVAALRALLRWRYRMADQVAAATRFSEILRLGADRYRQFFQSAPVALCALDPARRILAASDAWLARLGYRREEVIGQPLDSFIAPQDRGAAEHDWTRLLAGDPPGPRPRRLRRRDGTLLTGMVMERIERGTDGLIRRAGSAILEQELPALAGSRRDALARVVGGIAHDFNNLLMVLMGNLERLSAQAERADTVRRLAGMALGAAERGAGLTMRLLAAAGTQRLRPELVNANRLLREAATTIEQAAGPRVEVQFVFSPVLDPVRLDPAGFIAVVLALVANAREAMPRGGHLTLETANLPGPEPGAGRIAIRFADTGPGMTAEVLTRATEPFFTTRPPGRASGLGLSMAEGFARQSGGVLEIRSELGIGTTVALILPRPAEAGVGTDAEDAAHPQEPRGQPVGPARSEE